MVKLRIVARHDDLAAVPGAYRDVHTAGVEPAQLPISLTQSAIPINGSHVPGSAPALPEAKMRTGYACLHPHPRPARYSGVRRSVSYRRLSSAYAAPPRSKRSVTSPFGRRITFTSQSRWLRNLPKMARASGS